MWILCNKYRENTEKERGVEGMVQILKVDSFVDSEKNYAQAVDLLKSAQVVAFPTETVYGLGAIATDETAVAKIFEAKGRPSDNPLIVHVGTVEEVTNYVEDISETAKQCMEAFWPGPLTLVMKAKQGVLASNVTAGLTTVGIRMPDHPVALELLQQLKMPVAAPSANKSGKPSPTKAAHVAEDLADRIPLIVDGGATGIGLESTVLDTTTTPPVILRPGGVTKEMLEQVIGPVLEPNVSEHKLESTPKSPGMKYTHYAPNAPVYLIYENEKMAGIIERLQGEGHKVALLAPAQYVALEADYFLSFGDGQDLQEIGAKLYDYLRQCDKTDATIILATVTTQNGVGSAIMNRLQKAAGDQWLLK